MLKPPEMMTSLLAVEQDQEPVVVEAADVAGADVAPAFGVVPFGLARLLGQVVVSGHHRLGPADHLADLALPDLAAEFVDQANVVARHRLADRVQLVRKEVRREHGRAAAFGHAVEFDRGRPASA